MRFLSLRSFSTLLAASGAMSVWGASLPALQISQRAYLKASNTGANDLFGTVLAASGDTVVVGAFGEESNSTQIDEGEDDNSASAAGAAYIFVRNGTNWIQQAYLKASNAGAGDQFARSVSISGDTVAISSVFEASSATGVNPTEDNNNAPLAGAVYIFTRNGTNWSQQAHLKASNTGAGDHFGHSVAVLGNTLVVGADRESSSATGINADQNDNGAPLAGAAYIFVRDGTSWTQQAYIKASNAGAGDWFGNWVSISGETVVIGAPRERSLATGVNGEQNDNSSPDSGAAYVFVRNGTTWSQQAYLKASNARAGDWFGGAVSVSGDTIVVGAYREDSSARGIDGEQNDSNSPDAGAAYVFVRNGTNWIQQAYLKASNGDAGDNFGWSVHVSGNSLIVGADFEDSGARGVNGSQGDNSIQNSGAAYFFVRSGNSWVQKNYLKASNTGSFDYFGSSVVISGDLIIIGAAGEGSSGTGVNASQSDNAAPRAGASYVFESFESSLPPELSIGWFGGDLQVSWPVVAADFQLIETSNLISTAEEEWTVTSLPYQTNSTRISVSVTEPYCGKFYQLRKP